MEIPQLDQSRVAVPPGATGATKRFNPGVTRRKPEQPRSETAGTSPGINIEPGESDDGWIVPEPVDLKDGTRIQLYKDGEALHAAYEAIKNAKRRVCVESYIFASDETGRAFAEILSRKAREGVRCHLIYDSFGSINSDRSMFREMKLAGVNVRAFHPVRPWESRYGWRPVNRDHRKLLVIDDEIAGLGGLNVGGEYAGSWVVPSEKDCQEFWRDNAIGFRGPAAKSLLRVFANTWNYINYGGRISRTQFIHNIDLGPKTKSPGAKRRVGGPALDPAACDTYGILASVPTLSSPLAGMLTNIIRSARKSLQLTMAYFAPSDELIEEICLAAKRGVKVQLMLPARGDVQLLLIAARSFYEGLMSAGVEIYERQSVVLHAKTLVVDKAITVIGSTNLDYRSIEYNCELSAIIRSTKFGQQMDDLFQNDIRFAQQIHLKEWRRRPLLDRIGQWAVKRARYAL